MKFFGHTWRFLFLLPVISLAACTQALEQQNEQLSQRVDSLRLVLQEAHQENAAYRAELAEPMVVGFEVQIGAFEYFDVQAYQDELERLHRVESQGMNKYILGRFSQLEDAERFLEDVQRMGISDAWIAGIVDGERTTVAAAVAAAEAYYGDFQ